MTGGRGAFRRGHADASKQGVKGGKGRDGGGHSNRRESSRGQYNDERVVWLYFTDGRITWERPRYDRQQLRCD